MTGEVSEMEKTLIEHKRVVKNMTRLSEANQKSSQLVHSKIGIMQEFRRFLNFLLEKVDTLQKETGELRQQRHKDQQRISFLEQELLRMRSRPMVRC